MSDPLNEWLDENRRLLEERLESWLTSRAGCPERLAEAMRYSLLAPGKRLRPLLTLLACEAGGGKTEDALSAACAVEMIHTYSLIHDDLPAMDDDDTRRGLPTNHKVHGEGLAILAGDALLTLAFQVLGESYPAKTAAMCCKELAQASGYTGMVGGQVDDLAWENRSTSPTLEDLEQLHERKTGALIRASLRLGVWVAQAETCQENEPVPLNPMTEYGRCLGLAFQITDDLLDVEGDADQMGKGAQKDADRGKLTYPGLLGVAESRERARQLCQKAQECAAPFGEAGQRLSELAQMVLIRDR